MAYDLPRDYPLRAEYPKVKPIELPELVQKYKEAVIVDVRSALEYNVIHIEKAEHIPLGTMTEEDLLALRDKTASEPLVFYCNGITCRKSYKAAIKAMEWGFRNVYCFDAGIFAWAVNVPEKTVFLGKKFTAEELKKRFISKEKFKAHCLSPAEFIAKAKSKKFKVIDGRDYYMRNEFPIHLPNLENIPFDRMEKLIRNKSRKLTRKPLLIFDNVGKQVRWLQYLLEEYGFKDYYFLEGGVRKWREAGYDNYGNKK